MSGSNAPKFKMERVGGNLPSDPRPIQGKGRQPIYAEKLQAIVDQGSTDWWLIAEHPDRKASQRVLNRIKRGEILLPADTKWEFETREIDGKGWLYGRLMTDG